MSEDTTSPAHVRAWIETLRSLDKIIRATASPAHVRAWIETSYRQPSCWRPNRRPLTCGRGLKLVSRSADAYLAVVARSRAGVD